MDGSSDRIPSFLLYGDLADGREPPFVHLESIASRSRSLDWTIGAHRHDALGHILLIKGPGGQFLLDGIRHPFGPCSVISVPSRFVHGFAFAKETDGLVLTLSDSLLGAARDDLLDPELGRHLSRPLLVDLAADPAGFAEIEDRMAQIQAELAQPRVGQLSALRCLVALVLVTLTRHDRAPGSWSPCGSQDLAMVERLRQSVALSLAQQVGVKEHASRLGVTPARLNAACRRVAGCSTLHLLHAALLAEAKRTLLYTSRPVSEIAYGLGFEDPAYFSRFFSRRTGRTPSDFRAQHIDVQETS
jgi:AraC family transcriptional activator of pobA